MSNILHLFAMDGLNCNQKGTDKNQRRYSKKKVQLLAM